ncbi:hypothetical protein EVG20_g8951 [Dentipellis fragilis]|uniref:Uncharacterized protein n=1 Tax=Dentipellis fragilis TaxID=205917 RepID=A0A4Y9Y6C7_9AGAM|nr:hypothetical protein EVG20_g8951 [Dentipellis fragilis]
MDVAGIPGAKPCAGPAGPAFAERVFVDRDRRVPANASDISTARLLHNDARPDNLYFEESFWIGERFFLGDHLGLILSGWTLEYGLRTLDPSRLRPSDFQDFSDTGRMIPESVQGDDGAATQNIAGNAALWYHKYYSRFPPGTHGFLYYSGAPDATRSQVRFRVTGSDDPSSFSRGYDLLSPDETPWGWKLSSIAIYPRFTAVRKHLLEESLVTTDDLYMVRPDNLVYGFGDPFRLDLGARSLRLRIVGPQWDIIKWFHVSQPFFYRGNPLFSGSLQCCFEDAGRGVVVIRVLRIIEPVKRTPVRWPMNRYRFELVDRPVARGLLKRDGHPWTRNAKGNDAASDALKLLFGKKMTQK